MNYQEIVLSVVIGALALLWVTIIAMEKNVEEMEKSKK